MKPKNPPYIEALLDCKDGVDALKKAYAAGLADGEKRLARAILRWANKKFGMSAYQSWIPDIQDWLTARAKRGKK
jgi:hypothetical protein